VLSPSSRSYWPSWAALPDTVGTGIKPSSWPAFRSRLSPRLARSPDSPVRRLTRLAVVSEHYASVWVRHCRCPRALPLYEAVVSAGEVAEPPSPASPRCRSSFGRRRPHAIRFPAQDAEQSPKLEAVGPRHSRCLGSSAREPHRATTSGCPHRLPSHRWGLPSSVLKLCLAGVRLSQAGATLASAANATARAPRKRRPRALPTAWATCTLGPPRTLGRYRRSGSGSCALCRPPCRYCGRGLHATVPLGRKRIQPIGLWIISLFSEYIQILSEFKKLCRIQLNLEN
jgi:hypothetical protein